MRALLLEEVAEALPRRVAHATHALLVAVKEQKMPALVGEVVLYDEESFSAEETGAALRRAREHGLTFLATRYWVPTQHAYQLERALEDRYLRETERTS